MIGQPKIVNFLKINKDKPFTVAEIAKAIDAHKSNTSKYCKTLRHRKEIQYRFDGKHILYWVE